MRDEKQKLQIHMQRHSGVARCVQYDIKSVVAGDTRFMAQALMFLAERAVTNTAPRVRKPSAWNAFFGKGMRAGKSPAQIANEWKTRKGIKAA